MTIEERAERYVNTQCKGCRTTEKVGRFHGYCEGAMEQKAIDEKKSEDRYEQGYKDATERACYLFRKMLGIVHDVLSSDDVVCLPNEGQEELTALFREAIEQRDYGDNDYDKLKKQ